MNKHSVAPLACAVALACLVPASACAQAPASAASRATIVETEQQKLDYGIGVQMGRNLKNQGIDADVEVLVQGLRDALAGKPLQISEEELRRTLMAFRSETRQNRLRSQAVLSDENYKAGEAFLAANKAKPGVVTLPSGLQYRVLKSGTGPKPNDLDTVEVRYRGTFVDGTEFDSSARADTMPSFMVKASLPGWRQALLQMPAGSVWEIVLPPKLAYGPRGNGLNVGPQSTLVYELELIAIKAPAPKARPALD